MAAQKIVYKSLRHLYKDGHIPEELYSDYQDFGDDPLIKSGGEYCVSCLAFYPDGSIKDLSLLIKGGQREICPDIEIMDATSQMFY